MGLPKLNPLSKLVHLPVENIDVKVYAYTVQEEKNLLIAKASEDAATSEFSIVDLLALKCPDVDVKQLTVADIIALFINMISISKGTSEDLRFKCTHTNDDGVQCGNIIDLHVDLTDYSVSDNVENHKLVKLDDTLAVQLRYPTYEIIKESSAYNNEEYTLRLYSQCIEVVYYEDEVTTDFSSDEIYEWMLELPSSYLKYFEEFINTMPSVSLAYKFTCPKCGAEHQLKINSLIDFFTQDIQEKL